MFQKNNNKVRPLLFNAAISGVSPKNGLRLKPITIDTSQGFEIPSGRIKDRYSTTPSTPKEMDPKLSINAGVSQHYDLDSFSDSPERLVAAVATTPTLLGPTFTIETESSTSKPNLGGPKQSITLKRKLYEEGLPPRKMRTLSERESNDPGSSTAIQTPAQTSECYSKKQ